MKFTFFGTGAAEGWPALFCNCPACSAARRVGGKSIRTRSQALVNEDLLLDFPPDSYLHVLHGGLDLNPVKYIFITHGHEDHLYMEDLACRMDSFLSAEYRSPWKVKLYGSSWVRELYEKNIRERGSIGLPQVVEMCELTEYQPVQAGEYTVYPMLADHDQTAKCLIYALRDKAGKELLYAHDTGYLREDCWDYLKKEGFRFDLISLDCTMGKQDCSRNHMGLAAAASVRERLLQEGLMKPDAQVFGNHISHNGRFFTHEEIEDAARSRSMRIAYDGCSVTV